jgi:hypothetical protein
MRMLTSEQWIKKELNDKILVFLECLRENHKQKT